MSDQAPLNEEALEAMSRVMNPDAWATIDRHPDDDLTIMTKKAELSKAEKLAAAYLSAVPDDIVTTLEELDALPAGSVIITRGGRVWTAFEPRVSFGFEYCRWMCPDGGYVRDKGWFSNLPARVLYRPKANP